MVFSHKSDIDGSSALKITVAASSETLINMRVHVV
jgi:hypothetical protein